MSYSREYEQLMQLHDNCELIAINYANAGDTKLCVFYMNAAVGFKMKAERLSVKP